MEIKLSSQVAGWQLDSVKGIDLIVGDVRKWKKEGAKSKFRT